MDQISQSMPLLKKSFSKDFFKKYKIPTASYKTFDSYEKAKDYLDLISYPTVVKADGLAAGKGVSICETKDKVIKETIKIFKGKFKWGNKNHV